MYLDLCLDPVNLKGGGARLRQGVVAGAAKDLEPNLDHLEKLGHILSSVSFSINCLYLRDEGEIDGLGVGIYVAVDLVDKVFQVQLVLLKLGGANVELMTKYCRL